MCVIFNAIGMHTKPYTASLAFTTCNCMGIVLQFRLNIATKESFQSLKHDGAIKRISVNALFLQIGSHMYK